MDVPKELLDLNLRKDEAVLYVLLLKNGPLGAGALSRLSHINRSHAYQLLDRLIVKGFASHFTTKKSRQYCAIDPAQVLKRIEEINRAFARKVPALRATMCFSTPPIVEVLTGTEGIKAVLGDILERGAPWLAFGSSGRGKETLSYYAEHWEREREARGVPLRAVLNEAGRKRGKTLSQFLHTDIRYLGEQYLSPTSTWIYADRVAIIFWDRQNPCAIRMVQSALAESYRQHFELLWKLSKK